MAVVLSLQASFGKQRQTPVQIPRIHGMAVDFYGKPIVGVSLHVAGADQKYDAKTGENGTYSIALLPGKYTLRLEAIGFCRTGRGPFMVTEDTDATFDFQMFVCPTDAIVQEAGYHEEELLTNSSGLVRPVMLFGCRQDLAGKIRYMGLVDTGRYFPAVFTYNLMTVRANSLTFVPGSNLIRGEGDIIWQDGTRKESGSEIGEIEVVLAGSRPSVRIRKIGEKRWINLE